MLQNNAADARAIRAAAFHAWRLIRPERDRRGSNLSRVAEERFCSLAHRSIALGAARHKPSYLPTYPHLDHFQQRIPRDELVSLDTGFCRKELK